jgi:hypothetical protein
MLLVLTTREHNLALLPAPTVSGWENTRPNLPAYLMYFVFPLPLGACWLANRLKIGRARSVAILFAIAVALAFLPLHPREVIFLATLGLGVLAGLFLEEWKRPEHTDLFLVLWILIPLPIVYYAHFPIKYLLMEVIPVWVSRAAALVLIVASTGYSLLILRSDAEFANFAATPCTG